jgi:hypothetical protein
MDNEHDNLFFYSLNEINKLYIHYFLYLIYQILISKNLQYYY